MISLREHLDQIAISEGFPLDGFRLIVSLAACSVVAPLLHLLQSESLRHAFNVVVGLYMGVLVFDYDILHSISSALAVYALMLIAPRKHVGKLVLAFSFTYLLVGREYYNTHLLWNSAQMVVTLKLSSVAIDFSDGALPEKKLTASMHENHLETIPPFLQYLSYVFFFPTFLCGPVFAYKDFVSWMKHIRVAPLSVHARNFFVVGVSAAGFLLSMEFPVDVIDSPDFHPESPWATRCVHICVSIMLWRFQLYLAWSLAEAASALAGVGYMEKTGKWNGITNNYLHCVELPTNIRVGINNWNIGVARWMNTYIYQRVGLSKSGKPGFVSTMSAFFMSALWHGLEPGYYLFFILGGVYLEVGKHLRRRIRPFFHYTEDRNMDPHAIFFTYFKGQSHPLAIVYDVSGTFISWVALQYSGVAFEIRDVRRVVRIWSSWYFLPHIIAVGLLVLFKLFPERRVNRSGNAVLDTAMKVVSKKVQ